MAIRWYGTDLPFIEGPTVINMRDYNEDQVSDLLVGEVPPYLKADEYNGHWTPPAGLNGLHTCHREWFATGEPWPVTLPPTIYDDDWIPECCGRFGDATHGGIAIGGSAGDKYTTRDASSGGMEIGGQAGDSFRPPDATEGGLEIGGSAGDTFRPPDATEGGIEIGGEVGDVFSPNDPPEGGIEIGGEAGDVQTPPLSVWQRLVAGTYTFTAPVTGNYFIRTTGAGGAGAFAVSGGGMDFGGGGGGGGASASSIVALVAGTDYTVHVGAGGDPTGTLDGTDTDIYDGLTPLVIAAHGDGAAGQFGGQGGQTSACLGSWNYAGGNGADANIDTQGGGGGSSAVYTSPSESPPGTGADGSIPDGGIALNDLGGNGGDGGSSGAGGHDGFAPGGGGGGTDSTSSDPGGAGADGQITISWPS